MSLLRYHAGVLSFQQLNECEVRKHFLRHTGLRIRDESSCVWGHSMCLNVCTLDLFRDDEVDLFFLAVERTQQGPGAPRQVSKPTILIRTEKLCEP